jgi:predicted DNA-binding transcriptional regulator AlpA
MSATDKINSVDPAELLDASETAALLRQKTQTLAAWRCENRGPEYVKIGRSVFYRRSAVSAWLAGQIVRPTAA